MKIHARTFAITLAVLSAMGVAGALYRRSSDSVRPSSIAGTEIVAGGKQSLEVRRVLPRPTCAPVSVAIAAAQLPGTLVVPAPDLQLAKVLLDPSARPQESRPKRDPKTYPSPTTRTSELILFLVPGADAAAIGRDYGLTPRSHLETEPLAWLFVAASPDAADRARLAASRDPRVATALPNRKIRLSKHGFVPDDPYYPPNSPIGFPGQWHLPAANVPAAWNRDLTGSGVVLGILDDCLEFTHPDLAGNFAAAHSLNFGSNPPDNSYGPDISKDGNDASEDRHGTCVAGVAAAVGGNGIGVTGAAPRANVAINRITFDGTLSDFNLMNAVLYHASGSDTSVKIKNHSYGYGFSYVDNASESSAVNTSTGAGTIHVYSAGNSRQGTSSYMVDSNTTMPQNSADVITVAAVGQDNVFSYYSSFGANVFVTAPSSSSVSGITTTDRVGAMGYCPYFYRPTPGDPGIADPFPDPDYTSEFGGTSSAAPLVSGIMALGKQANPAMTVRLAQHCLVRSSDVVDSSDSTVAGGGNGSAGSAWITNGSAQHFRFNENYGFGRINAGNFCQEVVKYTGVTALMTETHTVNLATPTLIPDNNATGLSQTFTVPPTTTTPLESVLVTLNIGTPGAPHTYAGDLEAFITSPSGTVSRLMSRNPDAFGTYPDPSWSFPAWTFLTNAFWGEIPNGVWTVKVTDRFAGDTGTWYGFTVVLRMGTPIPDTAFPSVVSINRAGPDPTNANPIVFTVHFNKYVTGVDASDFQLITTGTVSVLPTITGVTGGVDTYQVSVDPGVGGLRTIQLKLVDDDSIVSGNGVPLGGPGTVNGDFVGQTYTVDQAPPTVTVTSTSLDGLYKLGSSINVTLTFSKAVSLSGGNLLVTLDTGAVLTIPPFSSRTTTSATYHVFAGEESPDLNVASLALSGGTLQDAVGNNASLVIPASQNLAFSRAILVDAAPPTGGVVLDGLSGPDIATQTSLTTISAHWSGFTDLVSGISGYRWSIGTAPGLANVMALTSAGLQTTASTSQLNVNLSLTIGTQYFVTVEARDIAGNTSIAATDGVTILDPGESLPTPPGSLDAIGQTSAIKLIWTPSPTATVGTFYRLWFKPSASPWTAALLVDNLTGTTTTISSLTIGISYDFELRTVTAKGNESAGVFTSGIPANPITVDGSGNYGSIQAAINAASSGDTVIIQGGTYSENLTLPAGVSLTGASPKLTILTAASGDVIVCSGNTTPSTISQLTVTGGQVGINSASGTVTLQNIVIHHTGSDGTASAAAGVLNVINCTIAHNGAMGIHSGGTTTVRNVIATGNVSDGVNAPAGATVTYTDSYANGTLQFSSSWNPSLNYGTPVTFTDEAGNVYTEKTGSFSIDRGDPSDAFAQEPAYNGGRINLGAYGNTSYAATSPLPAPPSGGGGGGGGCGLTGLEVFLLLGLMRRGVKKSAA